ncbi:BMC domain-containing protein [Bacilliculturomica massiliensis]|uniref:BMC domain-containing protein n=1 Tax=Bacilliculturomica massiliensis TaxID=1917867 RepID=UPI001031BBAB|nr:BMC domain-containing protein [Bacilliculturomica massiliensis]
MNAIGFIELNSIARGYEAADTALKTSDIEVISCHAGCPGKFYFLFRGYTSAVEAAMKAAAEAGKENIVDSTLIPSIHEDVIRAMAMSTEVSLEGALGVMEFFSVTAAIYAADAAAKAADVHLIEVRMGIGIGGKSYVTLTGTVSAVKEAVRAGITEENAGGMLIHSAVIPGPDAELLKSLY